MMRTPMNPTATAAHRWGPTGSRRIQAESAVIKRGDEKDSAVDWVRGSRLTAENPNTMPERPMELRIKCPIGRFVFRTPSPEVRLT